MTCTSTQPAPSGSCANRTTTFSCMHPPASTRSRRSRVGQDVTHEVFAREEYPERIRPGDYTLPVIIALKKQQ